MTKPVGPAWPYYGGKWNACTSKTTPYPSPLSGLPVIEPFAGAANYSLAHQVEKAILIDASPYVYGCWRYIKEAGDGILSLPDIGESKLVSDLPVSQEAKWLIGFHANPGTAQPRDQQTERSRSKRTWDEKRRARLAEISTRVQGWEIFLGNYQDAPDTEATWFIDPPYNNYAGYCYDDPYTLNFKDLGDWCRTRKGLVIVCEAAGADWLPFTQCAGGLNSRGQESFEAVWINRTC